MAQEVDDPCRSASAELRDKLKSIFVDAKCVHLYEAALQWCVDNGAESHCELFEPDVFPDFEQELKLKKLESRRLRIAFNATLGVSRTTTVESSRPEPEKVINATLDLASTAPPLRKMHTVAGHAGYVDPLTGDDWVAPTRTDTKQSSSENTESTNQLSRLATYDPYENSPTTISPKYPPTLEHTATYDPYNLEEVYPDDDVDCIDPTASQKAAMEMGMPHFDPLFWNQQVVATAGLPMLPMPMPMCGYWPAPWPPIQYPTPDEPGYKPCNVVPIYKHYRRRDGRNEHRNQHHWRVDGRKMRSSDREAVSPIFQVKECGNLDFRLVLKPKADAEYGKGKSNFRNSHGRGYIELRCAAEHSEIMSSAATLSFKLSISSSARTRPLPFRGPVFGNFREKSTAGLPESQDMWEFGKTIDHTGTFLVILEIEPDA